MSYLTQYAAARPTALSRPQRRARVDERTLLNRPAFDGGAYVRVFVEDTSARMRRRRGIPSPRLRLRIADCANDVNLEFSVTSAELRAYSLFKIDTLLAALQRFRAGLAEEAELYAQRQQERRRR